MTMKISFKATGTSLMSDRTEYDLAEGATLKDLMDSLVVRFGAEALGGLLTVNSELVYEDQAADLKLHDGDEVMLAPPLSGG